VCSASDLFILVSEQGSGPHSLTGGPRILRGVAQQCRYEWGSFYVGIEAAKRVIVAVFSAEDLAH